MQIGIKSEFLFFKLFKSNNLTLDYFTNKYDLKDIINILYLPPSLYDSLEKVKKIVDDLFSKKKCELKKEKDKILLIFKIPIFFEEVETKIELNKIDLDVDNSLYEEISNLKNKLNSNEQVISELKEKNEKLEEKMENLEKKINDMEILKKSMLIFEKMKDFNEKEEKRKKEIEDKLNHKFTKSPKFKI